MSSASLTEEMIDPQAWKGKLLYQLMEDCQATGVWDGIIRVGSPATHEEKERMAKFSPMPEVQEQLVLQQKAGVPVGVLEAL